jgi:hypothetical protein
MIEFLFAACVDVLQILGGFLGIGYKAINVWIFLIIWPALMIILTFIILRQRTTIQKLQNRR